MTKIWKFLAPAIIIFLSLDGKAQTNDITRLNIAMEITPLPSKKIVPLFVQGFDSKNLENAKFETPFIGKIVCVTIESCLPEHPSKKILKNNVFYTVEDILRFLY